MSNPLTKPFLYKRIPINPQQESRKKKPRAKDWLRTIKRIWMYLAAYKGQLSFVFLLVVLSSFLSLLGPFLIGTAIDEYLVKADPRGLFRLLIGLLLIYLFYSASVWLQNFWMVGVAQKTIFTIRTQLFAHLHKLPIPYFDKRQHGELMSRVTNDIENIGTTLNNSVIQIFSSVLTLIGMTAVMLWLSPLLTMITLSVVPLMVFGMKWITRRTSTFFKEQQRHLGDLNGYIEETITGQPIVKTYSREEQVVSDFLEKSERLKGAGFWAQTYSGFIPKLMNLLNNLSFAVIAGIGGILAVNEVVTIGMIVIFAEYSRQFTRPLNDLANQFNTLLSAVAGAERVFEVLDEKEETDQSSAKEVSSIKGTVVFQDVSFSYGEESKTVSNLSFHASPGETVALVGPTGAGKTTIINLLSRFYDVDSGQIQIDGVDVKDIQRESLRSHMAFVLQDSFLFEGTIRENIRYGRLNATDQEVEYAAMLANADSFIQRLPRRYDTMLKQDGSGISQGQKQLLSIARAILANPSLLVLDEATSSIDTVTEMKIQEALQRLMKGRTSFVIAHRLNTIQQADQILVLKEGQIIERGTHEQLLKDKGLYYGLRNRKGGERTLGESMV
ncbi:ABC transporter ATP-binding protein [Halalkalibacterium ligniniphilum]|uniref:ABC transporter ATP-binding protein n=1 Tax=Halalkalibacterium ligniniphilum TaxID=1134413 RepID=UPI00034A4C9B|nr:ABC transporter ATP-binding protein [Halalkalibacterium ligniniphilum]